jgi:hypothetical protein
MRLEDIDPFPPPGLKLVKRPPQGGGIFVDGDRDDGWRPPAKPKPVPKKVINWERIHGGFWSSCTKDHSDAMAEELGVPGHVLAAIGMGWSENQNAYTFPMYNEDWEVNGIRLRTLDGKKFSVRGSKDGVFGVPVPYTRHDHDPIVICEGPTDAAALWSLGFYALGRPSCRGGSEIIEKKVGGIDVVILADADGPGRAGAVDLANRIFRKTKSLKVIQPTGGAKDAREWAANGITADAIRLVINNAKEVRSAREIQCITSN